MADGTGGTPPPGHDRHAERPGSAAGAGATPQGAPSGPGQAAADWITIWQSELAALAVDREAQEGWIRLVGLWAQAAQLAVRLVPGAGDNGPAGHAGAAAAPGAAAVVAAPDARDAAIERLADRVEQLERQLRSFGAARNGGAGGA